MNNSKLMTSHSHAKVSCFFLQDEKQNLKKLLATISACERRGFFGFFKTSLRGGHDEWRMIMDK